MCLATPVSELKKPKTDRTMSILVRADNGTLIVELRVGPENDLYRVSPVAPFSGVGRAWMFEGIGHKAGVRHEVNLTDGSGDGQDCSCDCDGFRWGFECKHVGAVLKLTERGDLAL